MSYRVETASSGRATCKATECKKNGIKIDKNDLRLGSWVDFQDHGSWAWKHWGCVTGKQIQNLREVLEDPHKPGTYRWDYLDGYEGEDKNALDKHPDLQAKVRRVIEQGHIDPEDFNGDPEMNKLGETGIYTKEHKSKMAQDEKFAGADPSKLRGEQEELEEKLETMKGGTSAWKKMKAKIDKLAEQIQKLENAPAEKVAPTKKRVRHEGAQEEEAAAPPKKKRVVKPKVKKGEGDEEEEKPKPAKKSRAKKAVKKEESVDSDDVKMKLDSEDEEDVKPKASKGRAKKAIKKEESVESVESEDIDMKLDSDDEEDVKPLIKKQIKNGVKQEEEDESDEDAEIMPAPSKRARVKKQENVKDEQDDKVKLPARKASRVKKSVKTEQDGEAADTQPAVKKGRSSKKVPKQESSDAEDNNDAAVNSKAESSRVVVKGESKSLPNGRLSDVPSYNADIKGEESDSKFTEAKDEIVKDKDMDVNVNDDKSEEEKKSVKKAGGRVKKEKAATARGSRSRTSSSRK